MMENVLVSGIALDKNQVAVTVRGVEDRPGIAAEIFETLSNEDIVVDMIVQNVGQDSKANISFTVPQNELERVKVIMAKFAQAIVTYDSEVSKVSVVGVGMKSHSGIAAKAFTTLAKENINILMISTSEIKISILINEKYGELAEVAPLPAARHTRPSIVIKPNPKARPQGDRTGFLANPKEV